MMYHFQYTISNTANTNDDHIAGRCEAASITDAINIAMEIWPFNVAPMELEISYLGAVILDRDLEPNLDLGIDGE